MGSATLSINNLPSMLDFHSAATEAGHTPDFYEILWDNFCHLEIDEFQEAVSVVGGKVAFHIMWSRFIESDIDKLTGLLRKLREHADAVDPIYISDHLCTFRTDNIHLAIPTELDYSRHEHVKDRISLYQDITGRQLLIENYASTEPHGVKQISFINELINATECGLLFDISNARVASLNDILSFDMWLDFLKRRNLNCHIGGYAFDSVDGNYHDTHDCAISPNTWCDLNDLLRVANVDSVSLERDQDINFDEISLDLSKLRHVMRHSYIQVQRNI